MSDLRPTIAFLSPIEPASTGNGLAMRMCQFVDALAMFADVHVIVIAAAGKLGGGPRAARPNISTHDIETSGRTDTQFNLLSRIADEGARLAAFRAYGKPSLARVLSAAVLGDLAALVKRLRPAAIVIGRSYLLPCIEALPDAPVIVDLDEDDFAALSQRADSAAREGRMHVAAWLAQEGVACDALIGQYAPRLRTAFVSSEQERLTLIQRFQGLSVELAVNAIHVPHFVAKREEEGSLLFVGSLGYEPNVDGLSWFVEKVSPRLRVHDARVLVVGGGLPADSRLRTSSLELVGQAPLLGPYYARACLVIAPLLSGGGTRIKLLEAAAHRTAAVATSKAVAGLDWSAGWRADSPADFADACRIALFDRQERAKRAAAGLQWVCRHHARDRVVAHMAWRLRELLS